MLEKRLIFDLTKITEEIFSYTARDLESCYDRQLSKIGGIVEESIGTKREAIKLVSKVLPKFKHCIGTTHDENSDCYEGPTEDLGGTGQENVLSGLCAEMHLV